MKLSTDRILTTHVGSLPRSAVLNDLLLKQEQGEDIDENALAQTAARDVARVVRGQVDAGCDVINDGEQPRVGFQTYVPRRMTGFGGESIRPPVPDFIKFPLYAELVRERGVRKAKIDSAPEAVAEVKYGDLSEARQEAAMFASALEDASANVTETFMTAASPGIIAVTMLNRHYERHEEYVYALAREMKTEYDFVVGEGHVLQLDCPDLAMERGRLFADWSLAAFRDAVALHIDAINMAIADIPSDRVRLHCCWGNWDGPHVDDVDLAEILPLLYEAKVGALSLPLANPRHQHEYAVLKQTPPPDHMLLIPGVIDPTTNIVEHPEVVANRIAEAIKAVGDRERVLAGADCGFGTFAGGDMVAGDVVWAKLETLTEGARLASERAW
jgi:5-methyltetrahydropteroyltriglutamate--homocysteine methyltransferase